MDLGKRISAEISKTGFVLEHEIAQALKSKGWTVISGKYYVDDLEMTPREIDLLAYRVSRFDSDKIEFYTTLIISCKKSDENIWSLLAREINLKDPNTDYWPLHAWSNVSALTYQLAITGKAKEYHEGVRLLGASDAIADPQVDIFAFQEMNKSSGVPKNDKAIFSSITSLVKAQAYEISSLPSRKKVKSVYQFNLISVVDSDMYRIMFEAKGRGVESKKISSEHYIGRYIVAKREGFSRIRFLTSTAFTEALDEYGRLHDANVQWFSAQHAAFFSGIMMDWKRTNFLIKEFHKKVRNRVKWRIEANFSIDKFDEEPSLDWDTKDSELNVGYLENDDILAYMNETTEIRNVVSSALKEVYRYNGPFRFSPAIPF
ncbi:hypothetical protein ACLRDC_19270 [Gluconacetobacter sacchari]|uniref:hypothetical protein n=1 Tax=Gluconacetobacter sacchari TaxID=92759 RepID=UPI0039B6422E